MLKPYKKGEISFDLLQTLGQQGQNSCAYLAKDHQLDAEIVIKEVKQASLSSPTQFFDEAKALYASSHPNVVQIHYACYDPTNIYLAMPFYKKGAVTQLIAGPTLPTVSESLVLGCQVVSALHHIHSKDLIHFDVKPDNILLSDRGEALLSDFGLAKQAILGAAAPAQIYTPARPPEAFGQTSFDLTFDVYQLGLTLYRICNGNAGFYGQLNAYNNDVQAFVNDVKAGKFPDRKKFHPHIPTKLQNVIKRCLRVEPSKRYQSAIEVGNALAQIEAPLLDWSLTIDQGKRTWRAKNEAGTKITLEVDASGSGHCEKTSVSGTVRRVKSLCKGGVSEQEIADYLQDA
jgi:eukaryotic-like serine/threonine-protein kinase